MIYVNVVLTVKEKSDIEKVRGLLHQQAGLSIEEPGCDRFEVYQSQTDDAVFILVEQWSTQADLDRHRQAPGFTTLYQPQVLPLVDRVPHPSDRVF